MLKSWYFVVTCAFLEVRAMQKTSMNMQKLEINDQKMSGSGYSYSAQDGVGSPPQEFSFELVNTDDAFKVMKDLGYDPFTDSLQSQSLFQPVPLLQPFAQTQAPAPVSTKATATTTANLKASSTKTPTVTPSITDLNKLGIYPVYPYAPGLDSGTKEFAQSTGQIFNAPSLDSGSKEFAQSTGQVFNDIQTAQKGDSLDKTYNVVDAYTKGIKGTFNNKYDTTYYDQAGGNKAGFFQNGAKYDWNSGAGKVLLGGAVGQKELHDKGSKTTGYHKVYRKDDYNKQHKFYDKADRKGQFKKYGDFKGTVDQDAGLFAIGGSHVDGNASNKYGVKNASDKGKFEDFLKGYNTGNGHEGFYQDYATYNQKAGKDSNVSQGRK